MDTTISAREGMTDRITAIIQAEHDADKLQAESDALRWQAAELIAAELADGKSFRALAAEIGKSVGHVQRMAVCGRIPGDTRPLFNEAYQAAKGRKANPEAKSPKPSDDGIAESCSGPRGEFDPKTGATYDACGKDNSLNDSIEIMEHWVKDITTPGTRMNKRQHAKLQRMFKSALKALENVDVVDKLTEDQGAPKTKAAPGDVVDAFSVLEIATERQMYAALRGVADLNRIHIMGSRLADAINKVYDDRS